MIMSEPYLSEEQQIALFHAVGRRLTQVVTGTRGSRIAEQVVDIADIPLLGAFVSLKKEGELRSCMGTMSDHIPLAAAVEQATLHAATDDPRFPPICAAELFELDMEIWLLWGMKRVAQRGEDRLNAVEIGRHGVQIARSGNRGLLLPGVALDYDMDAQRFWEAVCQKAGLPRDAWLDDRSLLHTFEGVAIRGPVSATENIDKKTADEMIFAAKFDRQSTSPPMLTPEDLTEIQRVCGETFQAMTDGISPPGYFPGLFDAIVSGVSLIYTLPDRPVLICSKISIRPEVPFQTALIELLQTLGEQVAKFGVTADEIVNAKIDVTVFWDPVIHGTAKQYDVVDTTYRSVMVSSPQGWTVLFDPKQDIREHLSTSVGYLDIDDLDRADVISFETVSTRNSLLLSSVSKPNRGTEVRPPAIAGAFYPADAKTLNEELNRMCAGADLAEKIAADAILIPHAGWQYSGKLAARTFKRVQIPHWAIIFAPQHRGGGAEWAVAPYRAWHLPGKDVEANLPLTDQMIQAVDFFEYDPAPHAKEHSIEVLLPLLARFAPQTKISAVAMSMSSWEMIRQGAAQFAKFLGALPEKPLLIVSSDMNHFANDETTRRIDHVALDAIYRAVAEQNPEFALRTIYEQQISMCGVVPAVFVMETLRVLGRLDRVEEAGYTTSAETSGDSSRVVGYAGLVFYTET